MRAVFLGILGVLALLIVTADVRGGGRHAAACPTSAGMADKSKATKPSSFAPQRKPPRNAYGTPVGDKILTRRVQKKPPELHVTPLPDA